jgi:xanthine dehydrogenase accessory factor
MRKDVIDQLLADREVRKPAAVLTWLKSGEQKLVYPGDESSSPDLADALARAFRLDKSQTVDGPEGEIFINIYNPSLRMVIVGAVHAAQFLAPMAEMAGYDVTIVDPRSAFASEERFPGVKLVAEWPDQALPEIGLDSRTAFLALTHDPKIDDPALTFALESDAFYVGALGSKRTHAKRRDRLAGQGISEDSIVRIHAPIGLNIGAVGPVEIANSIMSEVIAVLRGRDGSV